MTRVSLWWAEFKVLGGWASSPVVVAAMLLAAPPAAGAPNPDKAHITVDGTTIAITPTGIDDTANIEWAMANLRAGGTVVLDGAAFALSETVDATNFNGALVGLGVGQTTIHLLDGFGQSELLGSVPIGIALVYDPDLPRNWRGTTPVTLSDFTLVVDGGAGAVWSNHGAPSVEVGGIYIVGNLESPPLPTETPTGVDLTLERLAMVGTPNDNSDGLHPWLTSMTWPFATERIYGGTHHYRDLSFESTGYSLVLSHQDSVVEIEDIDATATTAFGGAIQAVRVLDNRGSYVSIRRLSTIAAPGVQVGAFEGEPSTYVIADCDIDHPMFAWGWFGFELGDWATERSTFAITGNTIHAAGMSSAPISMVGLEDALIADNDVTLGGPVWEYGGNWGNFGFSLVGANDNLFVGNTCVGCGVVVAGDDNALLANHIAHVPGVGAVVAGNGNVLSLNLFEDIAWDGVVLQGNDNTVLLNAFENIGGVPIADYGTGNVTP